MHDEIFNYYSGLSIKDLEKEINGITASIKQTENLKKSEKTFLENFVKCLQPILKEKQAKK